jgi:hypothetical protein
MAIVCATVFATIVYRVQMAYILKETSVSTGCVKILFQGGNTVISNSMTNEFYIKLKLMKNWIYE